MLFNMALKNGNLISIDEVENGLKCDCFCPVCNSQLVARKGEKKVHHFAHYNSSECESYGESMLHLLAKQILEENKYIIVPSFDKETGNYSLPYKITFEKINVEKEYEDIKPDIIAWKNNTSFIFIEIAVTHRVDYDKLQKIQKYNVSTLEIDLGEYYKNTNSFDYNEFKDILLNQVLLTKNWIFDKNYLEKRKERMKYLENLEKETIEKLRKKKELEKRNQERRAEIFFDKNEKAVKIYVTEKTIGVLWLNSYNWLNGTIILDKIKFTIICKNNKNAVGKAPKFKIDLKTEDKEYLSYVKNCPEITFENVGAIWDNNSIMSGHINFERFKYKIKIVENKNRVDRKSPEYLISILSIYKIM